MFEGKADRALIEDLYEMCGKDFESTLKACLEMFGDNIDTNEKYREYIENQNQDDYDEEDESELKRDDFNQSD